MTSVGLSMFLKALTMSLVLHVMYVVSTYKISVIIKAEYTTCSFSLERSGVRIFSRFIWCHLGFHAERLSRSSFRVWMCNFLKHLVMKGTCLYPSAIN